MRRKREGKVFRNSGSDSLLEIKVKETKITFDLERRKVSHDFLRGKMFEIKRLLTR